jgi:V/A-type H+-transporting ATPase subunit A
MALIELGVPVAELAEMPQLAKARRCKSIYNSDQVENIREFAREVEQAFEAIRLEYAKQSAD